MKNYIVISLLLFISFSACKQKKQVAATSIEDNKQLALLFENYYDQYLLLFPLEATSNGDNRYNNKLSIDFTDSYRTKIKAFYQNNLEALSIFNRDTLNKNDKISFDIFKTKMEMGIESFSYNSNYIPCNQFWGLPLTMGQLGSGEGNQPFKTIVDYDNWLQRAANYNDWVDSAIIYFKKGMATDFVLPATLVKKMIPQLDAVQTSDVSKSLFYGPIKNMPSDFNETDRTRLTTAYTYLIKDTLLPAYKKLSTFLKNEYLPKARTTTGINALPDGDKYYNYLIRFWTTTTKSPDEIYNIGLAEVKRIHQEMEQLKTTLNFKGDLNAFFNFMKTDKQFMPFNTAEDVLEAYRSIESKIEPKLKNMLGKTPKTKFEIHQTETFRAASSSAEYQQGTADGSRPGIFYVPIIDPKKYNVTHGMESLFLHEAIPGHHFQISLQQENEHLPKFRRFDWYGAYGEGWALYCESLGKELGCYTDPYQQMGALGKEIHRAIRLVVDVGMHTGKMTREEAIEYMTNNEATTTAAATTEIERYMAIPGQALSYKIGSLKIKELRDKCEKQLGEKFSIAEFHDQFLDGGCMPLDILEKKMENWVQQKNDSK
jgi:uncharacterized protein (DUF885 family)